MAMWLARCSLQKDTVGKHKSFPSDLQPPVRKVAEFDLLAAEVLRNTNLLYLVETTSEKPD
jgi:hypothetical protein